MALSPDGKPLQLRQIKVVHPTLFALSLRPEPGWATLDPSGKVIAIRCAEGTVLGVVKVKPEGKSDRWANEFWNGLKGVKSRAKQIFFGDIPEQS